MLQCVASLEWVREFECVRVLGVSSGTACAALMHAQVLGLGVVSAAFSTKLVVSAASSYQVTSVCGLKLVPVLHPEVVGLGVAGRLTAYDEEPVISRHQRQHL